MARRIVDDLVLLPVVEVEPRRVPAAALAVQVAREDLRRRAERLGALPDTPDRVPLRGPLDPSGLVYAPNGAVFVPKSARPGVLPRMLTEILSTALPE